MRSEIVAFGYWRMRHYQYKIQKVEKNSNQSVAVRQRIGLNRKNRLRMLEIQVKERSRTKSELIVDIA